VNKTRKGHQIAYLHIDKKQWKRLNGEGIRFDR
jgi:hypothetical protein